MVRNDDEVFRDALNSNQQFFGINSIVAHQIIFTPETFYFFLQKDFF
jgi:hypothetical protein